MIDIQESIIINDKTYTKHVRYFLTSVLELRFIGFIDVKNENDEVFFHENLTQRSYEEFENLTAEEKTNIVLNEVTQILGDPIYENVVRKIAQREDAVVKGYMQVYNPVAPVVDDVEVYRNYLLVGIDNKCQKRIEDGFYSSALGVPHFYRFLKNEDQLNFNQQLSMILLNTSITEVMWKTQDAGILLHDKNQFLQVVNDAATHKQSKIARYWQIKAQILVATSLEELQNIDTTI